MRCCHLSDLHLESQSFDATLPGGDVLIIAGDLCHARCLEPAGTDRYALDQRQRVLRFIDRALAGFRHVLLIAGNHDHYEGVFQDTISTLRNHLPGVTVLDDETAILGGVHFFGATLWTDFAGRSLAAMDAVRRRMGEYVFVKSRCHAAGGSLTRFQPEDALAAHDASRAALRRAVANAGRAPLVVVTHHAPSRQGLNTRFRGNALDAAYASDLDDLIEALDNVPAWVHGHTHVARAYRIGATMVRSNALGFAARGEPARGFSPAAHFDL